MVIASEGPSFATPLPGTRLLSRRTGGLLGNERRIDDAAVRGFRRFLLTDRARGAWLPVQNGRRSAWSTTITSSNSR